MSKVRRNTLLQHNKTSVGNNAKDELLAMKYTMDRPDAAIYPMNDIGELVYPDYGPWKDHNHAEVPERDKLSNPSHLTRGYFEPPHVSNEYYSSRNLIQATIFSSTANCNNILKELSQHLTNAYRTRNEIINKIKSDSHDLKLPPRVTLTASKKEQWLQDLSNPHIPMDKISSRVPHGIRNKVLVDSLCQRAVPLPRALWFTKCTLYSELLVLRKKMKTGSLEALESQWLLEWTQQVADYVMKFSREMELANDKQAYMDKLHRLLAYVSALYVEALVDKPLFLQAVLKLLRDDLPKVDALADDEDHHEVVVNYGQTLMAITLVTVMWRDFLHHDYLCKELAELLLLNHYFIGRAPVYLSKTGKGIPQKLQHRILVAIALAVRQLFRHNTNVFIIPTYWTLISEVLYHIVLEDTPNSDILHKHLQLINYRNESLMLNMRHLVPTHDVNRRGDDILRIIGLLDRLTLNDDLAAMLQPRQSSKWRTNLRVVVFWCITKTREPLERILTVCNFLKRKVVQSSATTAARVELENEFLDIIYLLVDDPDICDHSLYIVINELYQLKVITIASYLRKLISLGIFYSDSSEEPERQLLDAHLRILKNLPVLNNKQCDNILQKWATGFSFKEKFETGKEVLQKQLVDPVVADRIDGTSDLSYVRHLNVGLQFLLVNWVTTVFKTTILDSPRLIHMTPAMVAHLYNFYAMCDNLTVFFKVIVKFILRNEGKVIIYYLDTLYLVARLILRHYKLVKFIAGNTHDSVSTAYNLFKLTIISYKDLAGRDFDYFHFNEVWAFIDRVVEKSLPLDEEPTNPRFMFSKETDLPMKLHHENEYTAANFKADLDLLLEVVPAPMGPGELAEVAATLPELGANATVADVLQRVLDPHHETSVFKLLVHIKRRLDAVEFAGQITRFAQSASALALNKLLYYEVVTFPELLPVVDDDTAHELLFGEAGLPNYQALMLEGLREGYFQKHGPECFDRTVSYINTHEPSPHVVEVLRALFIRNAKTSAAFVDGLNANDAVRLLQRVLDTDVCSKNQLGDLVTLTNEFNLALVQPFLRVLLRDETNLEPVVEVILHHVSFKFSCHNSYFGELFNLLLWPQRVQVLEILENIFLRDTQFAPEVSLARHINLLPILKDYFKKFLVLAENVPSTYKFFQDISRFLLKLVHIVNTSDHNRNLYDCISTYLRILIIHKMSLVDIILQHDGEQFAFIKNLILLLNSAFLVQTEKLQILLYDLLLLMKSSLTTALTNFDTEVKEDDYKLAGLARVASIFSLPEPSSSIDALEPADDAACALTLDDDELTRDSDYHIINNWHLAVEPARRDSGAFSREFGLLARPSSKELSLRSFELLEDTSTGLNDGCINLLLFDAYTTKENPP